uniref:ACB domain-containing protein n=1 Tax=Strigamia maritima TaxID=126957 RepID=T1JGC7_STRMM
MAATDEASHLDSNFDRLSISSETLDDTNGQHMENGTIEDDYTENWGFSLKELYKLASKFLKDKEGKAMQLTYRDRLQLVAYSQQIIHGPLKLDAWPSVGVLDVIGKDRRQAWMNLGNMSVDDAMAGFVNLLDQICPLFKPFIQAHKFDLEEKKRLKKLHEEQCRLEEEEQERLKLEEETRKQEEQERLRLETQKHQIQDALNQQTYHQFKAYAEQQYPSNPDQQAVLIRQLQEQHYQQYMQQIYQQQLIQQQEAVERPKLIETNGSSNIVKKNEEKVDEAEGSDDDLSSDLPPVNPASMWTRKDIKEFKDAIRKESVDSIIKVGHGETVTVRVPTHEDGTCLYWEFATDSFDIAFGVHFEWTKIPGSQVSVHISESEDDDYEEDGEESGKDDIEKGSSPVDRPPVTVVIPVYRRDCHEEVYAGNHVYPGPGVYLLKFDNSYSLWRSKTLYYRVFYSH